MKKIKVVIIEDNELMVEMIKESLVEENDIEIVGVSKNGEDGFKLVQSLLPDVVLLDLIMPGMDGFEVLSKSNKYYPHTKFLVISSLSDDYFVKKALSFGAAYFIVKPYSKSVLKERIYDLVNNGLINIEEKHDTEIVIKKESTANEFIKEKNVLQDKISDILLSIGIPANIIGFEILKEAIILAMEQPDLVYSITKGLYPELAKRLNNTVHGVERAIRHAIDTSWNKGRIDNINAILGVHVFSKNEKPTNSEFIAMLSRKLTVKSE